MDDEREEETEEEEKEEQPDLRTRRHKAPESVYHCPNCDEDTLVHKAYTKTFICPCGYSEER